MLKVVEEEKLLHNVHRYIGKARYLGQAAIRTTALAPGIVYYTTLFILLVPVICLTPFIAQGWSGFRSPLV